MQTRIRKGFQASLFLSITLVTVLLISGISEATPIELDVTSITYSSKSAIVSLTGGASTVNARTEYSLTTSDYGQLSAFCVENATTNAAYSYELLPVPSNLYYASLIADEYLNGGNDRNWTQEIAQIAIWETAFDSTYALNDGTFRYYSGLDVGEVAEVNWILANVNNFQMTGPVALAHSPLGGTVGNTEISQDFLVGVSVPDASLMWLLSPALIALGVVGRRRRG